MATKKQYDEFMRAKAAKLQADLNGVAVSSVFTGNVNNDSSSSAFALPFGVLGGRKKRGRGRPPALKTKTSKQINQDKSKGSVDTIKKIGIHACPQCQLEFDGVNCSPIQEACGHIKCRACFINSLAEGDNYCHQCEQEKNSVKAKEIETRVHEKADLIRAARSSKCTVQIKPISINVIAASKGQSQIKVKTQKTFPSPSPLPLPHHSPVSLLSSIPVIEKASQPKLVLLDRVQSSDTDTETYGIEAEKTIVSNFDSSVKFVENGNQNLAKKVPKVTLQIESTDCQGEVSCAKVKGLNSKKRRKRNPVEIPDHIIVLQDTAGSLTMYNCTHCSKKFKTRAHVKYHDFCGENALKKPYKCDECGRRFVVKSHYEYHLRTHTGERPYKCPKCGKGFNQRGKVTRHMRSHTGEKPFICQQCGRGFANAQALRTHFFVHTGERPFACHYCHKRFTGRTNLKKHLITHTGEKPFSCLTCGKSFGLKWTLDLHLRTHSSERPFACEQCTRAFANAKDLRRHLMIHSGERPWKCGVCGSAFRRKDNLDRHIKNTHNIRTKQLVSQLMKATIGRTGEDIAIIVVKKRPVKAQSQVSPRLPPADASTDLVTVNEKEIHQLCQSYNSNDKLNSVSRLKCDETDHSKDAAQENDITAKTESSEDLNFGKIKMEVSEAESIVEDLVREGLLPSPTSKNRISPIMRAEEDVIQEIFIKQEPVQMSSEMASYVPSQEVTVVHDEDGSTHIVL